MNVPYRYQGVVWLGLLTLILPLFTWRCALQDTVLTWLECLQLQSRLERQQAQSGISAPLRAPGRELILTGILLDLVRTGTQNGVSVAGYEPFITLEQDGMAIHTAQLTLTGSYTSLLRTVDVLEQTLSECRLRALVWRRDTNPATRREQLAVTLYIQQIILKQ